jgi:hypothetical protein
VPRDDAHDTVGRLDAAQRVGDQVTERSLAEPRGRHDLDTVGDDVHARGVEDVDVRRAPVDELARPVDRGRVERVVVAGQQPDRHGDLAQGVEGAGDDDPVELVGLEHVAAHQDELGVVLGGDSADAADRVDPRLREPRTSLVGEVVRGHPELPVSRRNESHASTVSVASDTTPQARHDRVFAARIPP